METPPVLHGTFYKLGVLFWGPYVRDPSVLAPYQVPRILGTLAVIQAPTVEVCKTYILEGFASAPGFGTAFPGCGIRSDTKATEHAIESMLLVSRSSFSEYVL